MRFPEPIGKWCEVKELPQDKKTKRWRVDTLGGAYLLGYIRWYGAWRQYAFCPEAMTVFEPTCMNDIAAFCKDETRKHRENRARQRAYEKAVA